ncbi:MAG: flippase-like domain-containing protein [Dysgonamonadaceae bacterium]|jgi:uncharacterized protein (TIRG00374 family)|nr:flippase-like domain-containing protein [Dysgonamonadaceae bacterium]
MNTPAPSVKSFKSYRILIPLVLGVGAVAWFFWDEFDPAVFSTFDFPPASIACIGLAFGLILLRDGTMMWRFRLFAGKRLSWRQAFRVNVLSEFTSALTPTAIGGSSLVVIFLAKEGIETGRSAAIMLINLLLDELYFVLVCPVLFLFIPLQEIFPPSAGIASLGYIFVGLYLLHLFWAMLLFAGIFIHPEMVRKTLLFLFRLPVLKRWYAGVDTMTHNLLQVSHDIGSHSFLFWMKACLLTLFTWSMRFLVANALFLAFVPVGNHLTVFARQVVLWIFAALMPTPGGSGMSELAFKEYYSDIFTSGSIVLLVTVVWRIITYYLYLLLGVLVLPDWLNKTFAGRKKGVGERL